MFQPIVSLPIDPHPNSFNLNQITNGQLFVSELNQVAQTADLPGSHWSVVVSFPPMRGTEAGVIRALLMSIGGPTGRVLVPMWDRLTPFGTAIGNPVVSRPNQIGTSITTSGWSANQSNLLVPGDYLKFEDTSQVVMVTDYAVSNSSGEATINFTPAIRNSPATGTQITARSVRMLCRLQSDISYEVTPSDLTSISFAAEEHIGL